MHKKENTTPSRQGVFYQLNLHKNNGPFLGKDIMYNNHKSNNLLIGKDVLDEHKMMVQTMTNLEKSLKADSSSQTKTENFISVIQYCEEELVKGQEISNYLYKEEHSFKKDIELLYDKISSMNNQLFQSSTCVLKNLMKKVKETNQTDKAEYYKIQKELHSVEMQKRSMEHMVVNCRNRIEELEKIFGVVEDKASRNSSVRSVKTNNFFQ